MHESQALDRLVRQVVNQVRWRRAEYTLVRGLFYGLIAGAVILLVKGPLGPWAVPLAVACVLAGAGAGLAYGLARRVPREDAARLADRAFGLDDRVATALECLREPARTPMMEALIADALARVGRLEVRQIVPRLLPREAKLVPVPLVAGLALVLAPAVPLPSASFFDRMMSSSTAEEEINERGDIAMTDETKRPVPRDPLRRFPFEERDFAQRSATGAPATAGDLSAIFKDTALATQRPDFNSFLKKGDERLKMLEQADRLPDLESDFTASQYKMMFRRSKELQGGLKPDQISPEKLRELLKEMERLGRKNQESDPNNWAGDVTDGMEFLEGGDPDKALDAMQKALDKMRAMEERQRGSRALRGGRDPSGRDQQRGDRGERGAGGEGFDDADFGEGEGMMPGRGRSATPRGEPTHRLRAQPFDVGVEGESRRGRTEAYDTNLTGRAGKMESRLQYMGVIGQYRKMMEDSIAREQVPRDYHTQIRDYFQSLDER